MYKMCKMLHFYQLLNTCEILLPSERYPRLEGDVRPTQQLRS